MNKEKTRPAEALEHGWWRSAPGILTGVAGVITAVAGLLAALQAAGIVGSKGKARLDSGQFAEPATTSTTNAISSSSEADTNRSRTPSQGHFTVSFPAGTKAVLRDNRGEGTYTILSAAIEQRAPTKFAIKFSIRLVNAGPMDIGFWDDSFRLVIDGVPRAPTSRLNDSVEARSAKEADVIFDLPPDGKSFVLQLTNGETADIPLVLRAVDG